MPVEIYRYDGTTLQPDLFAGTGAPITVTTGRDNLIPGSFFPNATNTGHITPANQMDVVSGNVSWGAEMDGRTITKTRFTGRLTLNTQNITFKDCIFEGYILNDRASFAIWPNGLRCSNIKVIDSTLAPAVQDHGTHIFQGHHITFTRCDMFHGVDAADPIPPSGSSLRCDVRFEGCWMHDLVYFSPDPFHGDNKTHNDLIQWGGGLGVAVVGCRLEGFADPTIGDATKPPVFSGSALVSGNDIYPKLSVGSGVMSILAGSGYPPIGEFVFTDNWMSGGSVGLDPFAATGRFTTADGSIIARNKWGWDWLSGINDVVYMGNSQVIPVQDNYRWGGPTQWFHGDEENVDPWDTSTPYNFVRRF